MIAHSLTPILTDNTFVINIPILTKKPCPRRTIPNCLPPAALTLSKPALQTHNFRCDPLQAPAHLHNLSRPRYFWYGYDMSSSPAGQIGWCPLSGCTYTKHRWQYHRQKNIKAVTKHPPWRNWLARQTVNLEVLSSILSGGGEYTFKVGCCFIYFSGQP